MTNRIYAMRALFSLQTIGTISNVTGGFHFTQSRVTAILVDENNRCVVSIACVANVSTGVKRLIYFSGRERIGRASLPIFRAAKTLKIFHPLPPPPTPSPHGNACYAGYHQHFFAFCSSTHIWTLHHFYAYL